MRKRIHELYACSEAASPPGSKGKLELIFKDFSSPITAANNGGGFHTQFVGRRNLLARLAIKCAALFPFLAIQALINSRQSLSTMMFSIPIFSAKTRASLKQRASATRGETAGNFLGDRFIPNRSLMDLDQAQSLLTNRTKKFHSKQFNDVYRQKLDEKLSLDSEGKPFRMLVFRGSPKSSRKSMRHIDEMREEDEAALAFQNNGNPHHCRKMPKKEARILDAPNIRNDYYTHIMDWGKNNIIAVALGSEMYLWNSENGNVFKLFKARDNDYPTSVAWSEDTKFVAVGFMHSKLQLWDAETSKPIRVLEGHSKRIATIAWNGHILTSGSHDKSIINHDGRARRNAICRVKAHTAEVCGLKWSRRGNVLASGGNDNHIYIWDSSKMSSSRSLHSFKDHSAAVKALAWCPYDSAVLASGGGTEDRCIKIWNVHKGTCICSIDTRAQVCGLEWNRHHKEILSGHGFSTSAPHNQLCLWGYPSMTKVGGLDRHSSRVLQLSQSPDGLTVVSAGADETLRFWDVFGPPVTDASETSDLDNLLSLKISPIR